MSRRRDSAERGFSLLELVVATAVLMVALALAAGLLTESLRIFGAAASGAGRRDPGTALRRLESDLRALPPAGGDATWSSGPLVLTDRDRAVAWALERGTLVRALALPDRPEPVVVPLLDHVVGFRWRLALGPWVDVEIVHRRLERPLAWRLASARWRDRDERLETLRLGVAPRRGPA